MSKFSAYGLVCLTVLLTVYGQFAIKWQVLAAPPLPHGVSERMSYLARLLFTPLVLSAFAAALLASVSWMLAMSKLPLSHAYPMTAMTFVLVVFGSYAIFGETINVHKLIGLALIVAGITVGSRG